MATILPAILVDDFATFQERLAALPKEAETVSLDIMDGTFVEPTTWGNATEFRSDDKGTLIELDLMVADPVPYIEAWAEHVQVIRAIFHAEIDVDHRQLIEDIHSLGLEAGIALLPETSIADVEHLLGAVDMVLIRGNEPGYSGRPLMPEMIDKIHLLRSEYPHALINVDIGVNEETIAELARAGATHLCANSAIFKQEDPAAAFLSLQQLAN